MNYEIYNPPVPSPVVSGASIYGSANLSSADIYGSAKLSRASIYGSAIIDYRWALNKMVLPGNDWLLTGIYFSYIPCFAL